MLQLPLKCCGAAVLRGECRGGFTRASAAMERGADVELEQVGLMEQAAPTAVDNWGKVRSLATDPNVDQRGAEGADAGSTLSLAEMRMQQAFDLVPRTVGGEPSSVTLEDLEVTLKGAFARLSADRHGRRHAARHACRRHAAAAAAANRRKQHSASTWARSSRARRSWRRSW